MKHVATIGISLDLNDAQVQYLSKFMGHEKDIHMNKYRQPIGTEDIFHVSQGLEYAQGEFLETPEGRMLVEEEDASDIENDLLKHTNNSIKNLECIEMNDSSTASNYCIPKKTNMKKQWDEESSSLVLKLFKERALNKEQISGLQIQNAIKENKCLDRRKVEQIRLFLQ